MDNLDSAKEILKAIEMPERQQMTLVLIHY